MQVSSKIFPETYFDDLYDKVEQVVAPFFQKITNKTTSLLLRDQFAF